MIKNYLQLVPRYLKSNKKTTISMVVSVLFSAMLLVSVGMIINTYNNSRIELSQEMHGKYVAGFRGVEDDLVDKLKKFDGIDEFGTTMVMGEIQFDSCRVQIKGADQAAMDLWGAKTIKGRLPENDYEIAFEQWIYDKLEYKPQIGEKFKLAYTYTDPNGSTVIQKEYEFTLCGIMADSDDSKNSQIGKAYVTMNTVLSQTVKYHRLFEQWFTLKEDLPIEETLREINQYALTKEHTYDNIINGYLANQYLIGALEEAQTAKDVTIFLNLIVALAAAMVIYNIFSISVLQRKKHYGLLRAIGITKSQIKGMMFFEAFLFGIILIPIGIILGILVTSLFLSIIGGAFFSTSVLNVITPYNIIFPSCVCMLSIIAAVYNPARLAASVSPIESMTMEDTKIKSKAQSVGKFASTGKLYGYSWKMAFTNLKRYKKRFIATIISMGIGVGVFVFTTYVIDFLNPVELLKVNVRSDYVLKLTNSNGNYGYSDEAVSEVKKIPGVKSVNVFKSAGMDYMLSSESLTPRAVEECANGENLLGIRKRGNGYDILTQIYGCSDEFIQALRDKYSSKDKIDNSDVFIVQNLNNEDFTMIKDGDYVFLAFQYIENGKYPIIENRIKVDHVLKGLPLDVYQLNGYIATFVPYKYLEDNFNLHGYQQIEVNIGKEADRNEIEKQLRYIAESQKDGRLVSYEEEKNNWQDLQYKIGGSLLGLVLVILIVGLINIVNTMNMNIIIRKREFGMLRALGMTKRDMGRVLLSEAALYGVASTVIGMAMGYLLIFIVYSLLKRSFVLTYYVNIPMVILTFIAVVLLSMLSTILPLRKATSEDIVESIQAVE